MAPQVCCVPCAADCSNCARLPTTEKTVVEVEYQASRHFHRHFGRAHACVDLLQILFIPSGKTRDGLQPALTDREYEQRRHIATEQELGLLQQQLKARRAETARKRRLYARVSAFAAVTAAVAVALLAWPASQAPFPIGTQLVPLRQVRLSYVFKHEDAPNDGNLQPQVLRSLAPAVAGKVCNRSNVVNTAIHMLAPAMSTENQCI